MNERWLPVRGLEDKYEVSDLGNVRSLDRIIEYKNGGSGRYKGKQLQPRAVGKYLGVIVWPKTNSYIHHLVLEAFVGLCPIGKEACHINDVKSDNRLANLKWDTKSENSNDAVKNRVHPQVLKTQCPLDHDLIEPNLVAYKLKDTHRNCLACARGRARVYYQKMNNSVILDLKEEADNYYRQIMKI